MIKYFIETPTGAWLSDCEGGPETTLDPMRALAFTYWHDALNLVKFMEKELGGWYRTTEHKIIEVENTFVIGSNPGSVYMGKITIGDKYHIIGIGPRQHDIEFLRSGDGC